MLTKWLNSQKANAMIMEPETIIAEIHNDKESHGNGEKDEEVDLDNLSLSDMQDME